ncbi:MAG: methionine--tRNA ligase [Elusimicrobia bacterium]|nr:methionine--tRNA ligase [Elusimicrobiota bacterium]
MKNVLVCVAWPYANSSLHLGQIAGACLPADIFARYHRLRGNRVLMVSGSDEHGTPITVSAEKENKKPEEIVERYHKEHAESLARLGISFDLYFRTSHPNHKKVAQDFFLKLLEKGYIEERASQALFCGTCNRFLPDRYVEGTCPHCGATDARGDQCDRCGKTLDPADLKNPRCRLCGKPPAFRETRLHYLKLSQFSEKLLDYLKSRKNWRPNVLKFTQNWIKEGLNDRPITRDLNWGIPVPLKGYEGKCLYVWFEAVIGYLSTSQEWARQKGTPDAWKDFWQDPKTESYYFIGKDNIPFHTIIWPAMLLGHEALNLSTNVPANEFLLLSGEKFSKSRGVGVRLKECLDEFDPDQIRYYLASVMPETSDANFTWAEFIQKNNEEFLSTIGNLINRVLVFSQKTYQAVPKPGDLSQQDIEIEAATVRHGRALAEALERCEFKKGLKEIVALAQTGNQYFNNQAPWKLAKENPQRAETVIYTALKLCRSLAIYMAPYVPTTSEKTWAMLGYSGGITAGLWGENLPELPAGQKLGPVAALVKKIEREEAAA